jgi:hypothetical protein
MCLHSDAEKRSEYDISLRRINREPEVQEEAELEGRELGPL